MNTGPGSGGVRPVDRTDPLPGWVQIELDLRRRMADGELTGRFPSEAELAAEYRVSRSTVRQAIRALRDAGLVEARQGAGTFVVDPARFEDGIGFSSLALTLRTLGVAESSVVRALERRPAGQVAGHLGLAATDDVVYVERLRMGDGEPLALDRSWLPAGRAAPLLESDLTSGPLYGALAERCGIRVTGGREHVRPSAATSSERELLRLHPDEVVLEVDRNVYAGTEPVEYRITRLRGDRYELIADWGVAGGTGVRAGAGRLRPAP